LKTGQLSALAGEKARERLTPPRARDSLRRTDTMTNSDRAIPGHFDFGLSEYQEARAARLHKESVVVDLLAQHVGGNEIYAQYPAALLADFYARVAAAGSNWERLTEAEYWPYEMSRQGKSHLIQDWYLASGMTCGTYGIGVHDGNDPLCNKLDVVNATLTALPWLKCVTTAAEIREAKRAGQIALYAHWQPVCPVPADLGAIDVAYAKSLRSFMLTYNLINNIGVGCTERVDAGLTSFGVDVVKHCNTIGMIVDVSHCGHLTTMDACRHSNKPVNANHTAAQGVYKHARGKKDDALRAIAATGGVIGVVTVPAFITDSATPSIEHSLDHVEYIANLVGWQHVAIGTDWPMQSPHDVLSATFGPLTSGIGFRPQDRLDLVQQVKGFVDGRDLPNITRGLVKRGFNDEQIRGILGENALRVFAEVCG
jgi:membrane dipeptidase